MTVYRFCVCFLLFFPFSCQVCLWTELLTKSRPVFFHSIQLTFVEGMFRVLFVFVALGIAADPLKVVDSYARYLSSGDCNAWANLFSPTGCKVDKPRKDIALVCLKDIIS